MIPPPDQQYVIRSSEPFSVPIEISCLHGDDTIWDSFKSGRMTGDFTVTSYKNVKVLGGFDVTKEIGYYEEYPIMNEYFAAPGDRRNNPLLKGDKVQTIQIKEAITMFHCVNCYGHFLLEYIPMFLGLEWLKKFDPRFEEIPVLTPQLPLNWQTAPIAMLEQNDYYQPCSYGKLYEISTAWDILRACNSIPATWISEYLKNNFLKKRCSKPTRRLFVSRSKLMTTGASRQILNYEEVLKILVGYGFEEVHPQDLTIFEQAELFDQATIVFGVHGSGNLNFAFCQEGQTLLEVMPSRWPCHYGLVCAGANRGKYKYMQLDGGQESNFKIDCTLLSAILKKELS